MRANRTTSKTQITVHGIRPSDELAVDVRERIAWLEQCCDGLSACRVRLEVPHRHRRNGRHVHVKIEMTVSGSVPIVVSHEPSLDAPGYAHVTIREAFDTARRRLQALAASKRELYAR